MYEEICIFSDVFPPPKKGIGSFSSPRISMFKWKKLQHKIRSLDFFQYSTNIFLTSEKQKILQKSLCVNLYILSRAKIWKNFKNFILNDFMNDEWMIQKVKTKSRLNYFKIRTSSCEDDFMSVEQFGANLQDDVGEHMMPPHHCHHFDGLRNVPRQEKCHLAIFIDVFHANRFLVVAVIARQKGILERCLMRLPNSSAPFFIHIHQNWWLKW